MGRINLINGNKIGEYSMKNIKTQIQAADKRIENHPMGVFAVVFILLILSAVIIGSVEWPRTYNPQTTELILNEYDFRIYDGQDACFDYSLISNVEKPYITNLEVEVNGQRFLKKEIEVGNDTIEEQICIPSSYLNWGDSIIRLDIGFLNSFFHVEKVNDDALGENESWIKILECPKSSTSGNRENITYEIFNGGSKGKIYWIYMFIDDNLDHAWRVKLDSRERKVFSEEFDVLGEGNKEIRLEFDKKTSKPEIISVKAAKGMLSIPPWIGFPLAIGLVFILPGISMASRISKGFLGFVSLTFALSVSFTIVSSWALGFLGILNGYSMITCLFAISLILFAINRFQIRIPKNETGFKWVLIIVIILTLLSLIVHLFLPSPNTIWSVYYERGAEAVYNANKIPKMDELSYLGKPFAYVPGYFLLKASFSWISGIHPSDIVLNMILQVILNIFVIFAAFYLIKSMKYDLKTGVYFSLFIYSSTFIFGWFIFSYSHLTTYALFLTALALSLSSSKSKISGFLAGIAGIFHVPFIVMFFLLNVALSRKVNIKNALTLFFIAFLTFLILYSYIPLNFGMGNEIEKEKWGYLIKGGVWGLISETAGYNTIALLIASVIALRGDKFSRKLGIFSIIGVVSYFILSYRVNVFLTIIMGMTFIEIFKERLKKFDFMREILIFSVFMLVANFWVYCGAVSDPVQKPFEYVNGYTSLDSNILVEPLYAHTENYFGKRRSLSDLCVEYADGAKYDDTVGFIETGDNRILDKYDIRYVITLKNTRIIGVNDYVAEPKEITFSTLDKIYDNGMFNIHWVR